MNTNTFSVFCPRFSDHQYRSFLFCGHIPFVTKMLCDINLFWLHAHLMSVWKCSEDTANSDWRLSRETYSNTWRGCGVDVPFLYSLLDRKRRYPSIKRPWTEKASWVFSGQSNQAHAKRILAEFHLRFLLEKRDVIGLKMRGVWSIRPERPVKHRMIEEASSTILFSTCKRISPAFDVPCYTRERRRHPAKKNEEFGSQDHRPVKHRKIEKASAASLSSACNWKASRSTDLISSCDSTMKTIDLTANISSLNCNHCSKWWHKRRGLLRVSNRDKCI